MRVRAISVLCALLAITPARAMAEEEVGAGPAQSIALLPLGADDAARGEQLALLALLAEELEQQSDLLILKPGDVRGLFDGKAPVDPTLADRVKVVQDLLDRVRRHYQFLEVDAAQEKLDSAEAKLAEVRAALGSPQLIVEFYLMKALLSLVRGERDVAIKSFARAAALDSGFEVTEDEYPPDVVAAFREGQEKVARAQPGTLSITSKPSGSLVFIDGALRGRTPLSIEVTPVSHQVRLQRRGCRPESAEVSIRAGQLTERSLTLELEWDEDELDVLDNEPDPVDASRSVRRDLGRFATRVQADFVLLARLDPEGEGSRAWLFSVDGARFWTRSWRFTGGGGMFDESELARSARDIAMAMAAGLPSEEERERVVEKKPDPGFGKSPEAVDEDRAWYKTWWFWGIVGGVVVGTAAGVTAWALMPKDADHTATILVEHSP